MTTCCSHCGGGACLLKTHVKDGVLVRIGTGDSEEPQFRACLKGRAYRQLLYHPDRLKYPLRRVGERGEGKFERISWDVALDTVATELKRVKETYGPRAIIFLTSGGDTSQFHTGNLVARLLNLAGGFQARSGHQSFEGGVFASLASYGDVFTYSSRDDLLNSRLIILWGVNTAITIQQTGTTWYLVKAKEAGAEVISIDPRLTNTTAVIADHWIPIRPGTDAVMLIAMAYVIINEGLQDQSYIERYTVGLEAYKRYLLGDEDGIPKTPAWAEAITGVSASVIEGIARKYATKKPAALIDGIGPGRTAYGEQYHRAAIVLAAITGNIGVHGGNSPGRSWCGYLGSYPIRLGNAPLIGQNPCEKGASPRPYSLPYYEKIMPGFTSSARIPIIDVADAMLKGKAGGYPSDYKFLYLVNYNYLNQLPNVNKTIQALKKMEFIITHEQFMTATAKFADIIFPTTTRMERNDINVYYGATQAYGYMNKVIEPLYECKSHFEICIELAKRMGIINYSEKTEEEWLRQIVEGNSDIPDYDTFKREGIYKVNTDEPYIAFKAQIENPANNPFPTPSGRIEIYSQLLADMNHTEIPPIPKYIVSCEGSDDPLREKYPLQLITTHFARRAHSQYDTVPWLRELEPQAITISTTDAQNRGIKDGDMVRVFNERGTMIISARVTERIMQGVVDIPQGAWYNADENGVDRGGCCNVLTNDICSPGGAFTTNTCLVQVAKL